MTKGFGFGDIFKIQEKVQQIQKELAQKTKLHEVLLDMVVRHLPSPLEAQKYRAPNIWHGDMESPIGKSMQSADDSGKLAMIPLQHPEQLSCRQLQGSPAGAYRRVRNWQ